MASENHIKLDLIRSKQKLKITQTKFITWLFNDDNWTVGGGW